MALANGQSQQELYLQLDEYDWDHDAEFQGGLKAILGSASSPEQVEHLTTRAKCFYYTRKAGTRVDFEGYQNHLKSRFSSVPAADHHEEANLIEPADDQAATLMDGAPHPASFAEICEMIASGKEIPGIKQIPDTVLEGQGSQANATKRKKPWEKDAISSDASSWQT